MSLINEALKRARQESRRRQALAKGLPLAPPARSVAHRSWLVAAVVAMALALLVSLVTIARLATDDRSDSESPAVARSGEIDTRGTQAESEASTLPTPLAETREATVPLTDYPGGAVGPGALVPDAEPSPSISNNRKTKPTGDPESTSASPESQQTPLPVEIGSAAAASSPAQLATPPTEGVSLAPEPRGTRPESSLGGPPSQPRVFIETAILANGEELALGGIAWSETGPYALLDERVIGLGETILGYRVTRIAPQEVELEGTDGAILIRLK